MKLTQFKRGLFLVVAGCAILPFASQRIVNSQTAQEEKTAEQTHKNIKSLTGLPDSQFGPMMNYFNAALGVQCNFCHVQKDGKMDFVSDEHEHKGIARNMIKMVQEVNKSTFEGKVTVSCQTCHQGRPIPNGTPTFPLAAPMQMRPPAAAGAAPAAPPPAPITADQVWDKYIQAVGGKDAVAKVNNRALKGSLETGNGMKGSIEYKIQGDKSYGVVTNDKGEEISASGFDGTSGWMKNATATRPLNPNEINDAKNNIVLLSAIKFKEPYLKFATGRKTKIGDREVNVMRFSEGKVNSQVFFDAETGLLLRRIDVLGTFLGGIPTQYDFEDYKDVDGIKLPMTVRLSSVNRGAAATRKFTEVKQNVSLDGVKFSQ
jgi:Photosynthetic reaction centre cytochrome C subunit